MKTFKVNISDMKTIFRPAEHIMITLHVKATDKKQAEQIALKKASILNPDIINWSAYAIEM